MTLALTESIEGPFAGLVLREHVVLASAGDPDRLFELLDAGRALRAGELERYETQPDGLDRVSGREFVGYYLDNLAARFANAGNHDEAERVFASALVHSPDAARIRYNFGTYMVQRQRYSEALPYLDRSIRLGWRDADLFINRGVAR